MGIYDDLQALDKKPSPPPLPKTEKKERKTTSAPEREKPRGSSNKDNSQQYHQSDSTLAGYHDSTIETIRKTVKAAGKEVSFIRLTQNEKNQLGDIIYTFKRQGVRTTENEVNRIALNLLLEDYRTNGANSVLERVIAALLA
jgi:hypothetical protein